jgi:class 3 adenylate cyclase
VDNTSTGAFRRRRRAAHDGHDKPGCNVHPEQCTPAQTGHDEEILSALLRPFPPKIAARLLKERGRLRLGGDWADPVTILFSDVRGFTA